MSGWSRSSRWRTRNGAAGRIACYYGCQAVRPYDDVDKQYNPMRMDELMQAVGAPTVDYSLKTKCCGGSLTGTMHEVGLRLNYILLKEAARKGAEAIVTMCPLCQFNLDVLPERDRAAERRAVRHAGAVLHPGAGLGTGRGTARAWPAPVAGGPEPDPQVVRGPTRRSKRMSETNGAVRIGVYVCHCGTNIAGMVDVQGGGRVRERRCPHVVVSRDYKYHVLRSRTGTDPAGHPGTRAEPHRGGLLLAAPARAHLPHGDGAGRPEPVLLPDGEHPRARSLGARRTGRRPRRRPRPGAGRRCGAWRSTSRWRRGRVPVNPDVLVVGGGIAGIHAALTLANAGKKVYLVEREPTIGGHMAMFDKTFPTLDCAACILTPKMSAVKAHPNITLWTYCGSRRGRRLRRQLQGEGDAASRATSTRISASGCLECIEACVFKEAKFPDEFNLGLSKRKPIYIPFPQAMPQVRLIDPETCIQFKTGKCKKTCVEACGDRNAIDFEQKETIEEIEVGAIILATGFKTFDAKQDPLLRLRQVPERLHHRWRWSGW